MWRGTTYLVIMKINNLVRKHIYHEMPGPSDFQRVLSKFYGKENTVAENKNIH